ncbi:hypothetical protein H6P81_007202 [Aristolochia fimbriata]|uniref:SWIM-type domain-containing protein n=1 Tax=Aristolochia fimbriata TaxID=158543 RepID=A0AAV7EZQ7_ARIFI|nr:hypothetical protein H6P81_007202 [Aristolochia fimbriata]
MGFASYAVTCARVRANTNLRKLSDPALRLHSPSPALDFSLFFLRPSKARGVSAKTRRSPSNTRPSFEDFCGGGNVQTLMEVATDEIGPQNPEQDIENQEPRVGQEFQSVDEAYEFYNKYARMRGFKGTKKYDKRRENVKTPRAETREGCNAFLKVSLQPNGMYKVTQFSGIHSHPVLSPKKSHFLKSHRKVTEVAAAQIELGSLAGIAPKQVYELQSRQVGGRENLGYLHMDHKNYLRHKRQENLDINVAAAILKYFRKKQSQNPACYFDFQLDGEGQVTNFFWADARSIIDYSLFGDVVSFDTTYRTNDYGRPFAPFVGVNHHNQTIVFGAALLYDETSESFVWLFETFLEAMSGKKPQAILTDQCAAMARAISIVLPESHHRLCTWHIFQNATKHLSNVFQRCNQFKRDFNRCVYGVVPEDEFLMGWQKMLDDYGLRGNSWLEALFKEREKWAMAYGAHTFCAGMRSTQRSESFNSVLRKYLHSRLDPMRFFEQFERLLEDRRHEELQADFKSTNSRPSLFVPCPILKQAASYYTLEIFALFQEEWKKSHSIEIRHTTDEGGRSEFKAIDHDTHRHQTVFLNTEDLHVWCSCCKFNFNGIQCSHIIRFLIVKSFLSMDPRYLLKRWSKDAKIGFIMDKQEIVIEEDPRATTTRRYMELCHGFVQVSSQAAEHETAYLVAREILQLARTKVDDACKNALLCGPLETNNGVGGSEVMSDSTVETRNHVDIPPVSNVAGFARRGKRQRGGSSLSRIKSSLEKARPKKGQKRTTILSKEMVDKPRTQRVLFDTPAMPTTIHSSLPLEVRVPVYFIARYYSYVVQVASGGHQNDLAAPPYIRFEGVSNPYSITGPEQQLVSALSLQISGMSQGHSSDSLVGHSNTRQ